MRTGTVFVECTLKKSRDIITQLLPKVDNMASGRIPGHAMSFKRFMLRQQVLQLYRSMWRVTKNVSDEYHQNELRAMIRSDFRRNMHHTDEEVIRMMITKGRLSLQELENSVGSVR